jgi:hypothetical protein
MPKTYNKMLTITLIKINGSKTNIHEIIPKFFSHNKFNNKVIIIVIINFIIAVLYNPKYMSIIIWITDINKYINAGVHSSDIYTILYA